MTDLQANPKLSHAIFNSVCNYHFIIDVGSTFEDSVIILPLDYDSSTANSKTDQYIHKHCNNRKVHFQSQLPLSQHT